jgi:hypothetical protein
LIVASHSGQLAVIGGHGSRGCDVDPSSTFPAMHSFRPGLRCRSG